MFCDEEILLILEKIDRRVRKTIHIITRKRIRNRKNAINF